LASGPPFQPTVPSTTSGAQPIDLFEIRAQEIRSIKSQDYQNSARHSPSLPSTATSTQNPVRQRDGSAERNLRLGAPGTHTTLP